ncbi:hypothetical protein Agub_g9061 [Astrephomene gubernaculifera]|uniref:PLAC8 family protein n=1 Tax=Astrephomene gubernaculifera TaxID=47775 RepID=A0AAD3DSP4_9CHLO|nr:hypothetical protein Agub_g9061 [Astrephomene gubernaculifera]
MGYDEAHEKQQLLEKSMPNGPAAPAPVDPVTLDDKWSTGLCDCCAHPGGGALGCVSMCLPFVQYGVLAQQLPKGATYFSGSFGNAAGAFLCLDCVSATFNCSLWPGVSLLPTSALLHMHMRSHLRTKYGIKGCWFNDLCTSWWCGPCALAQETREMIIRAAKEGAPTSAPPVYLLGNLVLPSPAAYTAATPAAAVGAPAAAPLMTAVPPPATGFPVPPTQVATITLKKAEAAPAK